MECSMLTIMEACKISKLSPSTLRRWCDNGFIEYKKTETGRLINKNSLLLRLSKKTTIEDHKNEASFSDEILKTFQNLLRDKEDSIKFEREQNRELRSQLKQAHEEILKMSYEIKAILTKDEPRGISRWIKTNVKEALSQF